MTRHDTAFLLFPFTQLKHNTTTMNKRAMWGATVRHSGYRQTVCNQKSGETEATLAPPGAEKARMCAPNSKSIDNLSSFLKKNASMEILCDTLKGGKPFDSCQIHARICRHSLLLDAFVLDVFLFSWGIFSVPVPNSTAL